MPPSRLPDDPELRAALFADARLAPILSDPERYRAQVLLAEVVEAAPPPDAGGDGNYVVGGGAITFSGFSGLNHVRSVRTFSAPFGFRGVGSAASACCYHYVALSTEPVDAANAWSGGPGVVRFIYHCGKIFIYGQSATVDSDCTLTTSPNDVEVRVLDSELTFSVGDTCELSLADGIGASGPLYVFFGGGSYGEPALWHAASVCPGAYAPTAAPSFAPTPGPTTKRFGTGLGIPVAFKICAVHGFRLEFAVEEGVGTTVRIHCRAQTED